MHIIANVVQVVTCEHSFFALTMNEFCYFHSVSRTSQISDRSTYSAFIPYPPLATIEQWDSKGQIRGNGWLFFGKTYRNECQYNKNGNFLVLLLPGGTAEDAARSPTGGEIVVGEAVWID